MVCRSSAFAQDNLPPIVSSASGAVPLDYLDVWSTYNPRLSVLYQSGDGVGYDEGFWSVQSFVPLAHCFDERLLFVDLHALFDENGALGGNFGLGHRVYSKALRVTVGGYVYYDYRSTGVNQFQQISPGLDVFGDGWELHANGYLPTIENTRQALPDQFRGNLLFIDRFESAMRGGDIEMGVRLPVLGRFQPRLFVGAYHFETAGRPDATGWKTRLKATMSDKLSTAFSVQDDQVFGTTANFGLEFRFSGASLLRPRPLQNIASGLSTPPSQRAALDYLAAPTRRTHQIVIDRDQGEVALDPNTGAPLMFSHVAAGGNSTGSFKDPYAFLTDALADPRYTAGGIDVIYVHGGLLQTVTHFGDVALVDGTHLLSSGPLQTIDTQLGPRILPFSGIDPNLDQLPQILGRVVLGNDTTLSGFNVFANDNVNTMSAAVSGDGITGFDINNNVLRDVTGSGNGIYLQHINGVGRIADNHANNHQLNGIVLIDSSSYVGDLVGNTVETNDRHGIVLVNVTFRGDVTSNSLNANGMDGLSVFNSEFNGNISGNMAHQNVSSGFKFFSSSTFTGTVTDNVVTGIYDLTTGPANPDISRLFETGNDLDLPDFDDSVTAENFGIWFEECHVNATIANNRTVRNPWTGIFVRNSDFTGSIRDNISSENAADGIAVLNSTFEGDIANNTTNANLFGGVYVSNTKFVGNINGNTTNENRFQGLTVYNSPSFTGDVTGNESLLNQNHGIVVFTHVFNGNIDYNTSNMNGLNNSYGGAGLLVRVDTFQGNIANNTTSANNGNAINVGKLTSNPPPDLSIVFDGNIEGNIAMNNTSSPDYQFGGGITIFSVDFMGNIVDNNTTGNTGNGISLNGSVASFTGIISDNTSNNNDKGGISVFANVFMGNIFDNLTNNNQMNGIGISSSVASFTGNISENTSKNNGNGIIVYPESFSGDIVDNALSENNSGGREFYAINSGTGVFNLFLSGNSSTNIVPAGQFNFDLQNNGAGTFNVTPNDVDAANDPGTVGSSNDTVNIP